MTSHPNLVGGEWIGGTAAPNINPSDLADVVGEHDVADAAVARAAVEAARQAAPGWARSGVQARCELLDRIGSEILGRADELADLLAREEGKALRDAAAEVRWAGQPAERRGD